MSEIRTKEINETAWTGKSIDSKITNNLTSIKLNCKSLKEGIEEIKSYNGKRRTEGPAKTISLGLTENEKSVYPEGTRKQTEIYETWEFRGLNDKNISLTAKIISEIDLLKHLLSENSAQFSDLEISAENLGLEYNKILALASASGIDIGSILLHNTDATTKSGESGDRTLDEDYSRIDESNYYLYEGLEDGEYLYLEAGTGVEAGTFFIMKHTKDGREVHMKNISAATAEDWANKTLTKLGQNPNSSKNPKDRKNINIVNSLGSNIINFATNVKNKIKNDSNYQNQTKGRANDAMSKYSSEFEAAERKYAGQNTFMTITNKEKNGYTYRTTHIVVNDPSQIKNIQSNDQYGTGGETIYSMAKRTPKLVVAATGGFFKEGGKQNLIGASNKVAIYNGKLVDTQNGAVTQENYQEKLNTAAGGQEICVDKNGKIFYAPQGATAKQLINDYGVVNTFTSHEAKRLDNGQIIQTDEYDKAYDRTYLCMKEPGEYYLVQGYSTPKAAVDYIKNDLKCTFAGSLEQGSAVSLVTKDETIQEHSGYDTIGNAFAITDT